MYDSSDRDFALVLSRDASFDDVFHLLSFCQSRNASLGTVSASIIM